MRLLLLGGLASGNWDQLVDTRQVLLRTAFLDAELCAGKFAQKFVLCVPAS
jgi:hypothetical protein